MPATPCHPACWQGAPGVHACWHTAPCPCTIAALTHPANFAVQVSLNRASDEENHMQGVQAYQPISLLLPFLAAKW